jgi:D-alanine-D-alanine ligase
MGMTLDKTTAKKIVQHHGVKTAEFKYVYSADEIDSFKGWFKTIVPVIIKPAYEGTSKGISQESICHDFDAIKQRGKWMVGKYPNQPVLIERFIKGYEFTVALVGNDSETEVLPPVQITIQGKADLGEDFYTHARVESNDIKYVCPAQVDTKMDVQLRQIAINAYKALDCKDFGRIDIRVDYNDAGYFLECNPLPNLGLIDVFPLVAEATNRTYDQLIGHILITALKRYNLV